jgi:hypothetical protein
MHSFMTQQMGYLVAESRPVAALLRPNTIGLMCFQAVLLLLQQIREHEVYILA